MFVLWNIRLKDDSLVVLLLALNKLVPLCALLYLKSLLVSTRYDGHCISIENHTGLSLVRMVWYEWMGGWVHANQHYHTEKKKKCFHVFPSNRAYLAWCTVLGTLYPSNGREQGYSSSSGSISFCSGLAAMRRNVSTSRGCDTRKESRQV